MSRWRNPGPWAFSLERWPLSSSAPLSKRGCANSASKLTDPANLGLSPKNKLPLNSEFCILTREYRAASVRFAVTTPEE
jgi:hypothetical protein